MSIVLALEDLDPARIKRTTNPKPGTPVRTITTFFRATHEDPDIPSAYIARFDPGEMSAAHYHVVDQFQVIIDGKGLFGRHQVSAYAVHFSRAHTAYGPLHADPQTGWAFMTLRTRFDPGAQQFPAARDKLKQIANRNPWQVMRMPTFAAPGTGVHINALEDIRDEHGLYAGALSMGPHARFVAPDPSTGDGQFILVLKGGLLHGGREHRAVAIAHIKPEDGVYEICAGDAGLEALVLNFPRVTN
jgi:hypothetical protein